MASCGFGVRLNWFPGVHQVVVLLNSDEIFGTPRNPKPYFGSWMLLAAAPVS